jgi:hypothetical protein
VIQTGEHGDFAVLPLGVCSFTRVGAEQLDGHRAAQQSIRRLVDSRHPARADQPVDTEAIGQ